MKYTIMGQEIDGADLPSQVKKAIVFGKVKRLKWVGQVALIAAVVDLALRVVL